MIPRIVEGLDLWNASREDWSGEVELSVQFHEHLREHAVPLDKRGIAILSGNSLGLDLYALFAYRLPRLARELHLSWSQLQDQIGTEYSEGWLSARKVREVMPQVRTAYPHARVEITRHENRDEAILSGGAEDVGYRVSGLSTAGISRNSACNNQPHV